MPTRKLSSGDQGELVVLQRATRNPTDSTHSNSPIKKPRLTLASEQPALGNQDLRTDTEKQDTGQQVKLERKKLATTRNPIIAISKGQMFQTQNQSGERDGQDPGDNRPKRANQSVSKAHDSDSSDSESCSKNQGNQKQMTVLKLNQRKLSISHREAPGASKGQPLLQLHADNSVRIDHMSSFDSKTGSSHPHTLGSQDTTAKRYAPSSRANLEKLVKNPSALQISQELSSLHTKSFNLNNIQLPVSLQRSNNVALRGISRNGGSGARPRAIPSLVQSTVPDTREQKKTAIKIEEVARPQTDPANIETFVIE